jgi:fumarate reductase flavoprotein subunit
MPGLFAAGEDTGGVHGANRLGGNGVANSTVFGGYAGEAMARSLSSQRGPFAEPDRYAIDASAARTLSPLGRKGADLDSLRRRLHAVMWDDVGILRNETGLARAEIALADLGAEIAAAGVPDGERRYNMTWTDRLNLENMVLVSRAILGAAQARTDSRGAHYRTDFPETSDLATSRYTLVRQKDGQLNVDTGAVDFTIVRPGESLVQEDAA